MEKNFRSCAARSPFVRPRLKYDLDCKLCAVERIYFDGGKKVFSLPGEIILTLLLCTYTFENN